MAYQNKLWQDFYEKAWEMRAQFMLEKLKEGANSYQAIKELAKQERRYITSMKDDKISWIPKEVEEGNALLTGTKLFHVSSMQGNYVVIPYHCEFNYADLLIDLFEDTKPYDAIIELGCGYGRNLFEIFYRGGNRNIPYFGGEFTSSGVNIARELAKATPDMNATFFHFNHLEPNLDILKDKSIKRAFVFTSHSIEQVSQIPDAWFEVVANIAPFVFCVNFEPFGFQAKILGEVSQKHKEFMQAQDWNVNFADCLIRASEKGIIKVQNTVLEIGYNEDPNNPGSLAIWTSDK